MEQSLAKMGEQFDVKGGYARWTTVESEGFEVDVCVITAVEDPIIGSSTDDNVKVVPVTGTE